MVQNRKKTLKFKVEDFVLEFETDNLIDPFTRHSVKSEIDKFPKITNCEKLKTNIATVTRRVHTTGT